MALGCPCLVILILREVSASERTFVPPATKVRNEPKLTDAAVVMNVGVHVWLLSAACVLVV